MNKYHCQKCEKLFNLNDLKTFSLNNKVSYLCPICGHLCIKENSELDSAPDSSYINNEIYKNLIFGISRNSNLISIIGMIILVFGIIYLSLKFFTIKQAEDIMHIENLVVFLLDRVNLAFHEAGHLFFHPFGRLIMFLGGSLNQILMPLIIFFAFWLHKKDSFGASVILWWVGENFFNVAPYINDARSLELILLGGQTGKEVNEHDWENILDALNLLHYDYIIADYAILIGKFLMFTAILWAILIIVFKIKLLKTDSFKI